MNNCTFVGNLAADAEVRSTTGGQSVTKFRIGSTAGFGERKHTIWLGCDLWGNRGEALAPYLKKGTPITVAGALSQREHEGKTYLDLRVNEVALHSSKAQNPF